MSLQIRENGAIVYEGIAVGSYQKEESRLVLNLGWIKLAGLALTVMGDPGKDRRRVVLARPDDRKRLEEGDQLSLEPEPELAVTAS